ncbi:response regulator [Longimicrobium sp.]|uniref:response regulator n=1 Tax=Longimicrobium sp. TaxID=2029185 RepID=UPI003B3B7490
MNDTVKRSAGTDSPGLGGDAPLRVLVVDDDAVDRMAVKRQLARTGISVETGEAEGVLEAIGQLADSAYDCVLLDFNLPDGDGLTFLRGLRSAGISVPVVMLTGQTDPEVVADLVMAGASDYIPKSLLTPERLLQAFSTCCGGNAGVRHRLATPG